MTDVDAASARKKNFWTWAAGLFWAGVVVWAIAGRDPAGAKGVAKPSTHATQSTKPSPIQPHRSLPAEPRAATPSMEPVRNEDAFVSDVESPAPATHPGPIELRREKATECGVAVLSPAKFQHELQGGIGQPALIDTYVANATWGSVVISCIRPNPAPSTADITAIAELMLQNVRNATGWKVVREHAVRAGKHIATEIDVVASSGSIPFTRWRLFVVGDVIHVYTLMLQYDPNSVPKLDTLLDSVKLNKRAGRGASRSVSTAWAPGWSSSSGWSPSSVLPPVNTGGDVHVKGHYRKDGTYVQPHTRSRPKR